MAGHIDWERKIVESLPIPLLMTYLRRGFSSRESENNTKKDDTTKNIEKLKKNAG